MDFKSVKECINLTPHTVSFMVEDKVIRIPPSGKTARMVMQSTPHGTVAEIPVVKSTRGVIKGVPEPKEGVIYITSSVVAKALRRDDVLAPDTTDTGVIRDGSGNIVAVKRLQCFDGESD